MTDQEGRGGELKCWEILPCPFCGSKEVSVERYGDARQSCIMACDNCGCRLESNEQGYGHAWNRRAESRAEGRAGGEAITYGPSPEFLAEMQALFKENHNDVTKAWRIDQEARGCCECVSSFDQYVFSLRGLARFIQRVCGKKPEEQKPAASADQVERVARAIYAKNLHCIEDGIQWEQISEWVRERMREYARAAIGEMGGRRGMGGTNEPLIQSLEAYVAQHRRAVVYLTALHEIAAHEQGAVSGSMDEPAAAARARKAIEDGESLLRAEGVRAGT